MAQFPGAEIVDVRVRGDEPATAPQSMAELPPLPDEQPDEDD
jgi:hypothetical protein